MSDESVNDERLSEFWWVFFLQGILTFVIGILLVFAPAMTVTSITLFLGIYWLMLGIISFFEIFMKSSRGHWVWLLLYGILGVAAGLIVMRHPLWSAALVLTLIVLILGIEGIIMGLINIIRGFMGDGAGAFVVGIVNIIIGGVLLANPYIAASLIPIVLGIIMVIGGISGIGLSFSLKPAK